MSPRSFEKLDYTLRPRKNVERKMLCEALSRFSAIAPMSKYRYVGLGSVSFKDFTLVHQRLGIVRMTSIEKEDGLRGRFLLNKPYSCVQIRWGNSSEVLPKLSWRERAIVWLDYDSPLDADKLADIETVVASVRSGSVLVVTVDAEPDRLEIDEDAPAKRYGQLKNDVGDERIPLGVKPTDLAGWGLARVSRDIIDAQISRTLAARNAPGMKRYRLAYKQLFNFHYADNAKMLTVGGYLANESDRARLQNDCLDDLPFVSHGGDAYLVSVAKSDLCQNWR